MYIIVLYNNFVINTIFKENGNVMKTVNLKSIIEIYNKNQNQKLSVAYLKYLDTDIKIADLNSLQVLIQTLKECDKKLSIKDLNGFYLGYKIPQIGKEFDLLRLTKSSILNIEYKSKDTGKIHSQLLQNKYYLKFLNINIYSFSFIENEKKLYKLNNNDELVEIDLYELVEILKSQCFEEPFYNGDLNQKFNPSNYLISPFSKTDEFMDNQYFLTQRQEEIEKKIYKNVDDGTKYIVISGEAGSGKTLLTYHIAKHYIENDKTVGLIHCAKLNNGHERLKKDYHWNIEAIKYWKYIFNNVCPDILIIDEFQRINPKQFSEIIENYIKPNNIVLILSGDGKQIFKSHEGSIFDLFENNEYNNVKKYKLNTKIRTNEKLANFIKIMLSLDKKATLSVSNENIDITYFDTIEEANYYIDTKIEPYSYISYTPSMYHENKYADLAINNTKKIGNAHEVIGQEFEKVIVILGEQFFYDGNKLKSRNLDGIPYTTSKMFFQQITRAMNKLEIVVVNNYDVFNKLIEIFE